MKKCVLMILLAAAAVSFAEWKPAGDKIKTRWADKINPETVWDEYPRPQFERSSWKSLNGLWELRVAGSSSEKPNYFDKEILVPFGVESSLSGVGELVEPDDKIWYHRTFECPNDFSGKKVLLNFEAVDWKTAVWVNDSYLGGHKGGYDRFTFDITDYLKSEGQQSITVMVTDPSSYGSQARGKQKNSQHGIWYTPVSGIWQTVWLEAVDKKAHLADVEITPDIDSSSVTVIPIMDSPELGNYSVRCSVYESGSRIAQKTVNVYKPLEIKIDNQKLWSPDNPFLYDLKLELYEGKNPGSGKLLDTVKSYFGMRKISLGQGEHTKVLMLNNKPLFHYGTLDQGWWPDGLHTPPSDEAMKYDIEMTKKMGFNMIRKHIKIEPDRWFYWCDKMGIMVWQDMPSGMIVPNPEKRGSPEHVGGNEPDQYKNSEDEAQFELELRKMISQHYNSPSVVVWVPFNEGWGQYDTCRISRMVKDLDPTRLVDAVSGWALRDCGDILDIHTYHKDLRKPDINEKDRATAVGEFGGIGYAIKGYLWDPNRRNWGYQSYDSKQELFQNYKHKFDQIVEMKKSQDLSAAVYTQTTDVEGEVNGLMTYDRDVVKFDEAKLRKLHSVLYEE
ncbi:Beta-galactosidase large subunit [Sedimentisphaera cyanobacteriorum]|uniref:Beta-galactosidase large subunit n=1 Tax=Sedimentisphaera cyanobacteriorum TaxID=1940790 RepID=A0A1Q2HQJ9_9BACT|nr:sugar-binding domain-containing protein [Sedimentisphaera cyanobacteriorum]AQQ09728.1 Beta-galactosidase large subunit [Sedimentisphaera cyanobacteriorum]